MGAALNANEPAEVWLPRAQHMARVHCPISWPEGDRCLNCREMFPCTAYGWAFDVLADAGWTAVDIRALDVRTGPWS